MSETEDRYYAFDGFRLDARARELRGADGAPVPLNARAFDTLCLLIRHRDRVVGKDELLDAVWAGRVVEENTLTQAISTLRRALGAGAGDHRYVVTVPGHGYRFVADVDAADSTGAVEAAAALPAMEDATPVRRRAVALGAVLFASALLAVVAWRWQATDAQSRTTLAVLPFRSLSADSRDDLLERGLAETLATRLGRSPQLRVSTPTAVAGQAGDALAMGRLHAAYVLEGSTQRLGQRVRVNVRLREVAGDRILWADTFDDHADRVFALQDRIAGAVTKALSLPPIVLPARAVSACDGENAEAYRAWLRGYYLTQRPTQARLEQAIDAFGQAIALDTACTRAWAGIALAYRGMAHTGRDPREVFPLAKAAVTQALGIDPDSPEALTAQGRIQHLYDWDWAAAEASFRRALQINPSLTEARFAYAHLLVDLGRYDEGLAQARQALELDPFSPMLNTLIGGFHTAARQPEAARARIDRALELQPDFWIALHVRGGLALDRGDAAAAVTDFERAAEHSHRTAHILGLLAEAQVASGRRAAAEATLRELQTRAAAGYLPATSLAAAHLALGHTEAALDALEQAERQRDIRMAFLKVDARWNPLRAQPRFRALARRMNLAGGRGYGRY